MENVRAKVSDLLNKNKSYQRDILKLLLML